MDNFDTLMVMITAARARFGDDLTWEDLAASLVEDHGFDPVEVNLVIVSAQILEQDAKKIV